MHSLNKCVLNVTKSAANRLKNMLLLAMKVDENRDGIVISTRQRGCNGHSYKMDYTTRFITKSSLQKATDGHFPLYVDNKSMMTLIGCTVDYQDTDIYSGFVFTNPNAKGSCGCGESFNV